MSHSLFQSVHTRRNNRYVQVLRRKIVHIQYIQQTNQHMNFESTNFSVSKSHIYLVSEINTNLLVLHTSMKMRVFFHFRNRVDPIHLLLNQCNNHLCHENVNNLFLYYLQYHQHHIDFGRLSILY